MAGWQREMRGDFCVEKGKGESAAEGRREACLGALSLSPPFWGRGSFRKGLDLVFFLLCSPHFIALKKALMCI
jgi:hypothetical protein